MEREVCKPAQEVFIKGLDENHLLMFEVKGNIP